MAKKAKKVEIEKTDKTAPNATRSGGTALVHDIEDAFSRMMHRWPWFGHGRPAEADDWLAGLGFPASLEKRMTLPRVDVAEKEDRYELTAELPGMTEKDVECSLSGDVLTVRGEKREDKEEDKKGYHMRERRFGSFERRFGLPDDVDRERLDAKVANGVLTVIMPRRADAEKPRSIEVKG